MFRVSNLAVQFGISRATILYYEKMALLTPAYRSDNGYRWYGEAESERLETILAYRSFGIPIAEIRTLVENDSLELREQSLCRQFQHLEQ